jgi:hypothetical protein
MRVIILFTLFLSVVSWAQGLSEKQLKAIAAEHELNAQVLMDYVESYNFKCPQELTEYRLEAVILSYDDYSELSIMMESNAEGWRDLYVQARSDITCFGEGLVSKAY